MKFRDMPYSRPDLAALLEEYETLAREAAGAGEEELNALFARHDALSDHFSTAATLAMIRHTGDVDDAFYDAENDFFDESGPLVADKQLEFYRAVLANPAKSALAAAYGPILLEKMEIAVKSASPEILPLMQKENALSTQYQKLYASAKVEFDGKTLNIAQLGPYKQSLDAATRRAAYEAEADFFDAHRAELDALYDEMVQNRTEQARRLGYDNYIPLAYLRMGRLGYGQAEVERYRAEVARRVVPAAAEVMRLKFERVGLPHAKFCDLALSFKDGNPLPHGTPEEILEAGKRMYHELSPETGEFIDAMLENELFDVLTRPGKAPGGYCTGIADYKLPFIFSNFNGTSADVDVLTHEAGHAFADYRANKLDLPGELRSPGMECCEIHSMSMEFLTSDFHRYFFGPDTGKYALSHAEDALFFLPYGCMVDEFQHAVYADPTLTPDQRNRVWLSLEQKYRPWVDFDGLPFYGRGAGWQRQLHIYECPFYYIDYCLAQTVALQFFAAWLNDKPDAWRRYLALVDKAGTFPYAGLVKAAGLAVPFDEGSLAPAVGAVAGWIKERQGGR